MMTDFFTNYDSISKDYGNKRKKPWKFFLDFLDTIQKEGFKTKELESGVVCDLGCGSGRHSELLSKTADIYIGTDISFEMLLTAMHQHQGKQRSEEKSEEKIKDDAKQSIKRQWIQCNLTELPFRQNTIDNSFSIAVVHHIQQQFYRNKVFSEIIRILKDNGFFAFSVWGLGTGKNFENLKKRQFYSLMKQKGAQSFSNLINRQRYNSENLDTIRLYKNDLILPWSLSESDQTSIQLTSTVNNQLKGTVSGQLKSIPRVYHFFSNNEIMNVSQHFKIIKSVKISSESTGINYFLLCRKK
jgi:SAM-dependent methyltransferase